VTQLGLVAAAGLGREVSWTYRVACLPFMNLALRRRDARSVALFGRALLYSPERLPHGWVERRLAIWDTPGAADAFFATVRAGLTPFGQRMDFRPRLPHVVQPVLLVWGRQDRTIPVAHAYAAHRALPAARLHVFDRCGHMPMWEYPAEFAQTVQAFLGQATVAAPQPQHR
jgi:4,5:9,10-diseco-3-hydroxy-5,9,17-trioxoandrosta-1(10),2-diene-4-oate hydrolase